MLRSQATDLHKPRVSFPELLEWLYRTVPNLVIAVRKHLTEAEGY